MQMSEEGTLIIPTEWRSAKTPVTCRGDTYYPKTEFHATVFGYRMGKKWLRAFQAAPGLRGIIERMIAALSWAVHPMEGDLDKRVILARADLKTIVAPVAVPSMRELYERCHRILEWTGIDPELANALALGPPPEHVTIYTSDPEGKKAIGINSHSELAAALFSVPPRGAMIATTVRPSEITETEATKEATQ